MTQSAGQPDWAAGTSEDHLDIMRAAAAYDLPQLACGYDWWAYPEPVLGWVMAQKCVDLGTAIAVFQRGDPERFNYLHKREVPAEYQGSARLLDNVCLRVNCGFYLVQPGARSAGHDADLRRLCNWMRAQKDDRAQGHSGRWVLDEGLVQALFDRADGPVAAPPEALAEAAPARGLSRWVQLCLPQRAVPAERS